MRTLAWFLGAIAGTLLLAALAAWPVFQLAQALQPDWPFHKVASRLWQLLLLAGIVLAVRRLRLTTRDDWGWGLPRARFLRQAGAGLAIGLATLLPMSLAMIALGVLEPRAIGAVALLGLLAQAAATGLAVAVVEETFFRGLMFGAVRREAGLALAVASTTLLYAAIHFLARVRMTGPVAWDSGFELLGLALARFAEPAAIAGSFVTLLMVGWLLALVRERSGAIAAGLGLHMGWVCVIKATNWGTERAEDAPAAWLVGEFDGYTGWLVAAWAAILLAGAAAIGRLRATRSRPPERNVPRRDRD